MYSKLKRALSLIEQVNDKLLDGDKVEYSIPQWYDDISASDFINYETYRVKLTNQLGELMKNNRGNIYYPCEDTSLTNKIIQEIVTIK